MGWKAAASDPMHAKQDKRRCRDKLRTVTPDKAPKATGFLAFHFFQTALIRHLTPADCQLGVSRSAKN